MADILDRAAPASVPPNPADSTSLYPTSSRSAWGRRALRGISWPSLVVLIIVLLWAIVPQLFTPYDPFAGVTSDKLQAPSLAHPFGTDHLGRDVYTRVVFGAASTVLSAALAVIIGFVVGTLLGLLAGFFGGFVDTLITGVLEVLMSIPGLLLALIIVTSFGYDTANTSIAVGISSIATFGRLMRAETRGAASQLYVEAATVLGAKRRDTLFSHVLPNSLTSVAAIAIVQFGSAVLAISALAFLGYGSPPPASDWGLLVANGKDYLLSAPWLVFFPSLAIVLVVMSLNRLSATLRRSER